MNCRHYVWRCSTTCTWILPACGAFKLSRGDDWRCGNWRL